MYSKKRIILPAVLLALPIAAVLTAGVVAGGSSVVPGLDFSKDPPREAYPPPKKRQVISAVPPGEADPFIAAGVGVGRDVDLYNSSGTGPGGLNTSAPSGSPERFIDTEQFPGGSLPEGVTITEAQALNVFARIEDNLEAQGLSVRDVITLRIYTDAPPGAERLDFAGLNRAYRQYFANVDLETGEVIAQPTGTGTPTEPRERNVVRPSRTALEVANLPVPGWLVEVEAVARYPRW